MPILAIIEQKTTSEMEKVLNEIKKLENSIKLLYWLIGALGLFMAVLKFFS